MASIGQLVAGIAHEINKPVNAIVNTVGPLEDSIQQIASDDPAVIAPRQSCRRSTTTRAPTTRASSRST